MAQKTKSKTRNNVAKEEEHQKARAGDKMQGHPQATVNCFGFIPTGQTLLSLPPFSSFHVDYIE